MKLNADETKLLGDRLCSHYDKLPDGTDWTELFHAMRSLAHVGHTGCRQRIYREEPTEDLDLEAIPAAHAACDESPAETNDDGRPIYRYQHGMYVVGHLKNTERGSEFVPDSEWRLEIEAAERCRKLLEGK